MFTSLQVLSFGYSRLGIQILSVGYYFVSSGVLDSEELSSMIEGDKSEKRMLPGIQEEICRSTDTISTLESDTLTLESIEANLFEDVRASIQKLSKASNVMDENTKVGSGVTENGITCGKHTSITCIWHIKKRLFTLSVAMLENIVLGNRGFEVGVWI